DDVDEQLSIRAWSLIASSGAGTLPDLVECTLPPTRRPRSGDRNESAADSPLLKRLRRFRLPRGISTWSSLPLLPSMSTGAPASTTSPDDCSTSGHQSPSSSTPSSPDDVMTIDRFAAAVRW